MLDKVIDFTNCPRSHRPYGGSDRKFGVEYQGTTYMIKFSEKHAKRDEISTSYVNNVISEFIGSHIAQSVGLPTHETVLGTYKDEIVVGCKDFRPNNQTETIDFVEYMRSSYDSKDVKRIVVLDQLYETLRDPQNDIPLWLQNEAIDRFWDTFVVDALVGNFDRHAGNWGFLATNNSLQLAPTYDFGSSLFPQVSDEGAAGFLASPFEMIKRCLQFPSPVLAITKAKVGKVGYYDMLASNYDKKCTEAVMRMVPKINMATVCDIVDQTPLITDVRKDFYKTVLRLRYDVILYSAYIRCAAKEFDAEALDRMIAGKSISDAYLKDFVQKRVMLSSQFAANESLLLSYFLSKQTLSDMIVWMILIRSQRTTRRANETRGSVTKMSSDTSP